MTEPLPVTPQEPGRLAYVPDGGARGWRRWMPGLQVMTNYQRGWLMQDISAGLVLAAMLIPVGIAYAEASGIPGIYGLYATIVPLLAYALFGPSKILVLGPDSALVALILAVVLPLSGGDPAKAILIAGLMAIISGLICIGAGLLRLGFVTELLSKPIRYGFMNGIAFALLVSQIPRLAGISIDSNGLAGNLLQIGGRILQLDFNLPSLLTGLGTIAIIYALKPFPRIPGMLLAVIVTTAVTSLLKLDETAAVAVLGSLPRGLPEFSLPWIGFDELETVAIGSLAVALVSFADTSVLSRSYAAKTRSYVNPDQEMIGLGMANLTAGFFQGFPVCASASRTPVAESAGAKTQLANVVGALSIALLLLAAPDLLEDMPVSALAAIVITSAISMFEVRDLRRIYRIQNWEFWLSMACFAGVVVFGVIEGIGLAIVIAVIEFLWDGWRPHSAILGRVNGIRGYHDIKRYPDARRVPGLVLFRWDAPLFFANAELFQELVLKAVAESPTPVRWIIVAAEPVTSIDITSADMLTDLLEILRGADIELHFAELKDPVKDKIRQFELQEVLKPDVFHPTVGAAVDEYLHHSGVDWKP